MLKAAQVSQEVPMPSSEAQVWKEGLQEAGARAWASAMEGLSRPERP